MSGFRIVLIDDEEGDTLLEFKLGTNVKDEELDIFNKTCANFLLSEVRRRILEREGHEPFGPCSRCSDRGYVVEMGPGGVSRVRRCVTSWMRAEEYRDAFVSDLEAGVPHAIECARSLLYAHGQL